MAVSEVQVATKISPPSNTTDAAKAPAETTAGALLVTCVCPAADVLENARPRVNVARRHLVYIGLFLSDGRGVAHGILCGGIPEHPKREPSQRPDDQCQE